MRAGKLRHRLTLQTATDGKTATGRPTRTWATTDTLWGSVMPLSGSEVNEAQALEGRVDHEVHIRYRASVTPKQRLIHRTRTLEIVSVRDVDEMQRELVLMCREVTT